MSRAHGFLSPRRRWPLAATLGVHLLLAWYWRIGTTPPPARNDPLARSIDFILIPAPAVRLKEPPPVESSATARAAPRTAPAASTAVTVISTPIRQPESQAATDPFAEPAAPAEGVADRARREAGAADHALRQGKPAPLESVDTPWKRFAHAVEGAHIDGSRSLTSESYTTPDGVTIYRFRRGGKVYCRTGGHVRPRIGGAEGGGATSFDVGGGEGAAGLVRCPNQAEFRRD